MPYIFALSVVWTQVTERMLAWTDRMPASPTLSEWVMGNSVYIVVFALTVVAPCLLGFIGRFLVIFAFHRGLTMRFAHVCPKCKYIVPTTGGQVCPECGTFSTFAQRTATSPALASLEFVPWLRRFTLAVIVGILLGPGMMLLKQM